ncbi:MAG: transglutaminase domain-containing protein [Lachnospiraceae bacterium]|nr:transglutaminase domain-containing protein [Lachnospiraceae bacterium]
MRHHRSVFKSILVLCLSAGIVLSGCGVPADAGVSTPATASSGTETKAAEDDTAADSDKSEEPEKSAEPVKGTRDNTSRVLTPSADGTTAYDDATVTIDTSNISAGYFMIDYKGTNEKPKLQVTGPEGVTYTFDLHGELETIPFTQGSGTYQIAAYENIGDSKYSQLCAVSVDADISNEYSPYLYPNQYVDFNADSNVVTKGEELAFTANNDLDVVTNVYNYMIENVTYDMDLANNVKSGYLPDPDRTLATGTGICFDYAACMASMLRSQQIPTRLEIGYAGDAYHAWISTYIDEVGWVNGIVEFNGTDWELMDPTFAASQGEKALKSFIGDGSNYVKVYQY